MINRKLNFNIGNFCRLEKNGYKIILYYCRNNIVFLLFKAWR